MILRNMTLDYFYIVRFADLTDKFPESLRDKTCQNLLAILRNPYHMVFQIIYAMLRLPIVLHCAKLVNLKTSPKCEGFSPIPRNGY
jgi:hypothetical protein